MFGRDAKFQKHDLSSVQHFSRPEDSFAAMRNAGPLAPTRLPFIGNVWMATTYSAGAELLKSPDLFARQPERAGLRNTAQFRWWMPKTLHRLADNMMSYDDPEHRRMRGVVDHAFARRDISGMEPSLTRTARSLLNNLPCNTPIDIATAYTRELPFRAICDLLGLNTADSEKARAMTDGLGNITGLLSFLSAMPGLARFRRLIDAKFIAIDTPPDQGLIGLLQLPEAREILTENEAVAMVFLLFVGGHETTQHLINGAILTLIHNPEIKHKLLQDWSMLPLFLEEVLRHFAPVQMTKPRFVTNDTTFHGIPFKKGAQVAVHIGCANRDPAKYQHPDVFDPTRKPNPHLAFSAGPHFCLGLMLARLETQVTLQQLFSKYPNLDLASDTLDWRPRIGMRALRSLPLNLN